MPWTVVKVAAFVLVGGVVAALAMRSFDRGTTEMWVSRRSECRESGRVWHETYGGRVPHGECWDR